MVLAAARIESDVEQIEKILRHVSERGWDAKEELDGLGRFFGLTDESDGKSSALVDDEHWKQVFEERWKQTSQLELRESTSVLENLPASVPDSPIPVTEPSVPFIVSSLPGEGGAGVSVAVDPRNLRLSAPQPRSLVRRIAERLALGVAALALFGWVWMAGQIPPTTNTSPLHGTSASTATIAPPAPAPTINNNESKAQLPSWFSPQILYPPTTAP
jgi:hypothetical protein